jgi:hypothetical protein
MATSTESVAVPNWRVLDIGGLAGVVAEPEPIRNLAFSAQWTENGSNAAATTALAHVNAPQGHATRIGRQANISSSA